MNNSNEFDYIVVGQGLAGSALSYQILKAGKRVLVIDDNRPVTSSKVAAGLYNPVTGRKMVKTWKADTLFPYLISFYKELEELCGDQFLIERSIYRPFLSMEEQNEWMGKSASEEFEHFITKVHHRSQYAFSTDDYGGIELNMSGYLDIPRYLKAYRSYLESKKIMLSAKFDHKLLKPGSDAVVYRGYSTKKIIFCNGLDAFHNTHFDWLPFQPVKGEVLQIKTEIQLEHILNRGVFVIPIEDDVFKVGSNYDNKDHTMGITSKAREEITMKLKELVNVPFEVVDQIAGVRPATKDRRPFIGLHPEYETIGIFSGLGTKGVSLAPYFSGHFIDFLEHGKELYPEVNISRYFSLYYDSLKN
ncbi:hypothetical protein C900_01810 [Fulvivirga imtechensis AK7]|uniref:FAD dependent oxidoreductase domain-containing protein n=1 Tax=Fulvivirga imtechensis AK7 TaxID=1237149 RepID=L8JTG4_9BACT|nr:FAD-dependent oxidoreductase [Fulvivirga imtechensis]ELR72256.1 hypothetical protein C900_01810 [Fulvivirga imtechensis AK7]